MGTNQIRSNAESTATDPVLLQVAGFLRHELPIRLAKRIADLDTVPMMKDMASVQLVRAWYLQSFLELTNFREVTTKEDEADFARALEVIYERHSGVLVTMARGAMELRKNIRQGTYGHSGDLSDEEMQKMHKFLDNFYMSRIGIRILIGQYLELRQPPLKDHIGMISSRCNPAEILGHAIEDATFMCNRLYHDAPEVEVVGGGGLTFPYVPTHMHYIMLELLKNSMRATVEWHGVAAPSWPPIRVVIADGEDNEDVVLKVSDEGGGIKRSHLPRVWDYLFTTAGADVQERLVNGGDHDVGSPLAGLGYGLPISRAYARFFGGDLNIMSMEGYGTDVFLHLHRLGDSKEPLP